MDGTELQVCRHPAGAPEVRSVAVLCVAVQPVVDELLPLRKRGRLPGIEAKRDAGVGDLALFDHMGRTEPAYGIGIRLRGLAPADFPPLSQKRCENLVGFAVFLGDPTG